MWRQHFAVIHAGTRTSFESIACEAALQVNAHVGAIDYSQAQLLIPAFDTVKGIYQRLVAGKAHGEDGIPPKAVKVFASSVAKISTPLHVKAAITAQEPWQWRGGMMHHIPKASWPAVESCDADRGIILADSVAKAHHRLIRQALAPGLASYALTTMCGGICRRTTDVATFMVRLLLDHDVMRHRSIALCFVDASNAFYSILRSSLGAHASLRGTFDAIAQAVRLTPPSVLPLMLTSAGLPS